MTDSVKVVALVAQSYHDGVTVNGRADFVEGEELLVRQTDLPKMLDRGWVRLRKTTQSTRSVPTPEKVKKAKRKKAIKLAPFPAGDEQPQVEPGSEPQPQAEGSR